MSSHCICLILTPQTDTGAGFPSFYRVGVPVQPLNLVFVPPLQAAVTALLARKAKPSPLTWAAAGRAPATPADLAAANGHAGLAAFLGEALLSQLLLRLKPESRRDGGRLDCVMGDPEP